MGEAPGREHRRTPPPPPPPPPPRARLQRTKVQMAPSACLRRQLRAPSCASSGFMRSWCSSGRAAAAGEEEEEVEEARRASGGPGWKRPPSSRSWRGCVRSSRRLGWPLGAAAADRGAAGRGWGRGRGAAPPGAASAAYRRAADSPPARRRRRPCRPRRRHHLGPHPHPPKPMGVRTAGPPRGRPAWAGRVGGPDRAVPRSGAWST